MTKIRSIFFFVALALTAALSTANAQDSLPVDNGLATYYTSPRYRESESHPLRIVAYALHPVGWVAREVIFRPFSYFASSTEVTRSVLGYREPYDYRQPECFSADDTIPDCRAMLPFNYSTWNHVGGSVNANNASNANTTSSLHTSETTQRVGDEKISTTTTSTKSETSSDWREVK